MTPPKRYRGVPHWRRHERAEAAHRIELHALRDTTCAIPDCGQAGRVVARTRDLTTGQLRIVLRCADHWPRLVG